MGVETHKRSMAGEDATPRVPRLREDDAASMLSVLGVTIPGVLLSIVLVSWNYSAQPMWRDEWYTYSASQRTLPQLAGLVSNIDGGLSVFYLFMHAWTSIDDSIAWMRVPAAVSTVVIAGVVALVGRRIGGSTVGVLSGVLVALLPAVVDHAQEARAYPLALAEVAGTGLAMLRHLARPSRGRGAALAGLALAASAVHPIVGAPAVAGIFLGSLVSPGRARRGGLLVAGLPAGIAAGALLAVGFVQVDAGSVSSYQGYSTLFRLSTVVSPSLAEVGVMALIVVAAALSLVRVDRPGLMVLLGWSALPIVVIAASAVANSFYLARYVSSAALGIAVLVAYGIVRIAAVLSDVLPVTPRYLVPVVATVAVGALAAPLIPDTITAHTQRYRVEDPEAGAQALADQWRVGDAVVFTGPVTRGLTTYYSPTTFRPADPLLELDPIADRSYRGREADVDSITGEVQDYRRVWLVSLLRQRKIPEVDKKERATVGRDLVRREDFGQFSLELWQ